MRVLLFSGTHSRHAYVHEHVLKNFDVCFIGTNHDVFNYKKIANNLRIIFDSRNSFSETKKNIIII